MNTLLILLLLHFAGDFICQSNWMAINKSKSWLALTAHVSAYTSVFGLLLITLPDSSFLLRFLALTFALHFVTDAITSRITSRLWFVKADSEWDDETQEDRAYLRFDDRKRHWFFVAIGADQLIHAVCLVWAYQVCF